ncbi:SPW repeat protein [Saccharothrix sp. BKS2]|uniref:SPW repeat protein n=1 Tax=Saccharothrix lopnurensis TaxID=1670621 RepID=A0ABW1PCT5_9PSEU
MRVDQPPGSARRLCAGLSVAAFLLGLWQLMSPVALGYGFTEPSAAVRDAVVAGAVVVVVALVGMMAPLDGRWPGPVLVLAGWWIAAVPWLTGVRPTDTAALGNALVTGCAVALLGIALAQVARVRR